MTVSRISGFPSLAGTTSSRRSDDQSGSDMAFNSPQRSSNRDDYASETESDTSVSDSDDEEEFDCHVLRVTDLNNERRELILKIGLPVERNLTDLKAYLRRAFKTGSAAILPSDDIRFYCYGTPLDASSSSLLSDFRVIHYRVFDSSKGYHPEFFHQYGVGGFAELTDMLLPSVQDGATIGELRVKIAEMLKVNDSNRIMINTARGFHMTNLAGNHWEVQKTFIWQPRGYVIRIVPPESYIILRGMDREFVYHPPDMVQRGVMDRRGSVDVKDLQTWLEKNVLKRVDKELCNVVDVEWIEIHIYSRDKRLGSFDTPRWGSTLDFNVPNSVAKIYVAEEKWLLPDAKECQVCFEETHLFHHIMTPRCEHKPSLCKKCVDRWIQSSLEAGVAWDHLACPDCQERLRYEDVQSLTSREVFERYDRLTARDALNSIPNFRWCLSPTCGSGQIHDEECPRFTCSSCGHRHCTTHNIPWHRGMSCEQFNRANTTRQEQERASERHVNATSVVCPGCAHNVHKFDGCNHMTCICSHEFCYECLGPYFQNDNDMLVCNHKEGCSERIQAPHTDFVNFDGQWPDAHFDFNIPEVARPFFHMPTPFEQARDHPVERPHEEPGNPLDVLDQLIDDIQEQVDFVRETSLEQDPHQLADFMREIRPLRHHARHLIQSLLPEVQLGRDMDNARAVFEDLEMTLATWEDEVNRHRRETGRPRVPVPPPHRVVHPAGIHNRHNHDLHGAEPGRLMNWLNNLGPPNRDDWEDLIPDFDPLMGSFRGHGSGTEEDPAASRGPRIREGRPRLARRSRDERIRPVGFPATSTGERREHDSRQFTTPPPLSVPQSPPRRPRRFRTDDSQEDPFTDGGPPNLREGSRFGPNHGTRFENPILRHAARFQEQGPGGMWIGNEDWEFLRDHRNVEPADHGRTLPQMDLPQANLPWMDQPLPYHIPAGHHQPAPGLFPLPIPVPSSYPLPEGRNTDQAFWQFHGHHPPFPEHIMGNPRYS